MIAAPNTLILGLVSSLILSFSAPGHGEAPRGELNWPSEWTVFVEAENRGTLKGSSVSAASPTPAAEILQAIPEVIKVPEQTGIAAREVTPRQVKVEPGKAFDLNKLIDEPEVAQVVYAYLELDSPEAQTVTVGMGSDWWLEAWLNGEPVFDTLEEGNLSFPPTILDHTMELDLREGANLLVVRAVTGRRSGLLAVGGPGEFPRAQRLAAEREEARRLNVLPERFEDRLLFPVEEQAVIMARRGLTLPETDAELGRGDLAGVQPMPRRQKYFDPQPSGTTLDTISRRFDEPVKIRLSKYRYPWEDRHLDAMVWTTPEEEDVDPEGRLVVRLKDAGGDVLAEHEIEEFSPHGLFFSVGFPEALKGGAGTLEVIWMDGETELGRGEAAFHVNRATDVALSGRVPLRVLNGPGATILNAPMTLGVPFPRGALEDDTHVRLVDEDDQELPLQTRVTARWSRFGPVKWLLCDFTIDLEGEPREVYLEFGPDVERMQTPELVTGELGAGFPALDSGRIRITEEGLAFDPDGSGDFHAVLAPQALLGAFVHHENGKEFKMPADAEFTFEELGSEKAVVLRTGWYADEASAERFCQFVTRFVFHRDSPVVRIFHTWIFTGDGNLDRIADMGWRFDMAAPIETEGFLTAFDDGEWIQGPSVVQFDYQAYLLPDTATEHEGRTPGVLSATVNGSRITFGAKDFWQNFPSELELTEESFTFYNWPKNNPPSRMERPVARNDAFRNRFVHEGEVLDFRIPDEYAEGEIWRESSSREGHIGEGRPESVNAQGIARTEEMFLYFTDASVDADEAAKVIQGLNDETLRAVADPQWVVETGIFGKIHPSDPEQFPDVERLYELTMEAPARWVERLGFYGMWLHGDYPGWNINLPGRWVSPYRTLRKNHHGFPLRWTAYVRSGNPRFLKLAENAARQMADANFCHYATADVDASVGPDHFRRQGWWDRSLLPWMGRRGPHRRSYTVDTDYLWDTYYLTGYGRTRDVALLFGELTQQDHVSANRARTSQSMLKSYLDMYQATFDPWFLNAAWEIADMHVHLYGDQEVDPLMTDHPREVAGFDHWRRADQAFFDYTGFDDYAHIARNSAVAYANPLMIVHRAGAGRSGGANGVQSAYAWLRTGDPLYLARLAAVIDYLLVNSYEGEEMDYFLGAPHGGHAGGPNDLANAVPMALAILSEIEEWPDPIHYPLWQSGSRLSEEEARGEFNSAFPEIILRHGGEEPLIFHIQLRGGSIGRTQPVRYEIDGPGGLRIVEESVAPETIELKGAPGDYRVRVFGSGETDRMRVFYPLSNVGTPEVFEFETGEESGVVQAGSVGYWFYVPVDVESFWIDFTEHAAGRTPVNRVSVWDPDGRRVYDRSYHGEAPEKVEIAVAPEQAGKVWRATGGNFRIDSQIPPYFSVTRGRWFNPEAEE